MKQYLALAALCLAPVVAQTPQRWSATTGAVSLSSAGSAATIQQPATGASQIIFEYAVVYCSVACQATITANGAAATTTAGTVQALLPSSNLGATAPFNFFTASNASGGVQQGGIVYVQAGVSQLLCLNTQCGQPQTVSLGGAGTNINYTISIGAITGTANITYFLETK